MATIDRDIQIREYKGESIWDDLFPITKVANVEGLLDTDNKIIMELMPDVIINGMHRVGSIALTGETVALDDLMVTYPEMAHGTATKGDYWIITHTTSNATITITEYETTPDDVFQNPSTGEFNGMSMIVNPGDWIIYDGYNSGLSAHQWSVINNNAANLYKLKTASIGNITHDGKIGAAENLAVVTTTGGKLTTGTVTVASGGTGATTAAGALTSLGAAKAVHEHGNIKNDGKIGADSGRPLITGANGLIETKSASDFRVAIGAAPIIINHENGGTYFDDGDPLVDTIVNIDNALMQHNHSGVYSPNDHVHGNISNTGYLINHSDNEDLFITTDANGKINGRTAANAWVLMKTSALGSTSTTAFPGNLGNTAYGHSQITSGNPHGTKGTDITIDADGYYVDNTDNVGFAVSNLDSQIYSIPRVQVGTEFSGTPRPGDILFKHN